jgi:crotonobetainyl-CoA:carnitine CoA-transferase CaiB-like acyl-CoA transferase
MPAPRFSRSEAPAVVPPTAVGADNDQVFADWGVRNEEESFR